MSGFVHTISVRFEGMAAINKVIAMTERLDKRLGLVEEATRKTGDGLEQMGRRGRRSVSSLTDEVGSLAAKIGLINFGRNSLLNAASLESFGNVVKFTSGATDEAAKNMEFFNKTVDNLSLPMKESMAGFQALLGDVKGTNITMETTRKIFEGVGKASRVLGIDSERVGRAFTAIGQIAGSPNVSMEELKTQLKDALPSSMAIAARAMDMPIGKFTELVGKGKIMSEDFLPKFAAELNKTFDSGVANAMNSAQAKFDKFNNSVFMLSQTVGSQLLPAVIPLIDNFLVPAITLVGENIEVLGMLGTTFLAVRGAALAYTTYQGLAAIVTGKTTLAFWGLNSAMLANPMTWVVGGLVALSAAAVYSWNKFEGFRGALTGVWYAMIEFKDGMINYIIAPFQLVGKVIQGIIDRDFDKIKSASLEYWEGDGFVATAAKTGQKMGKAFSVGYGKGVDNFNGGNKLLSGVGKMDALSKNFSNFRQGKPLGLGDGLSSPKLKEGITAITGGGKQVKNITINVGKMVDGVEIHSQTTGEGVDEMTDIILRKILQMTNSMNQIQ